jgi:hypothetical protein
MLELNGAYQYLELATLPTKRRRSFSHPLLQMFVKFGTEVVF